MTDHFEINLAGLPDADTKALFEKQERTFDCEVDGVPCTGVVERKTWRRYSFPGEHAIFHYEVRLKVADSWHYTCELRYEGNGLYRPSNLRRRSASGYSLAQIALSPGKDTVGQQFARAVERCVAHYKADGPLIG